MLYLCVYIKIFPPSGVYQYPHRLEPLFPSPPRVTCIYIYIFVQHLPAAILIRNILIYNEIPQDYLVAHARHHKAWNVGDRPIV